MSYDKAWLMVAQKRLIVVFYSKPSEETWYLHKFEAWPIDWVRTVSSDFNFNEAKQKFDDWVTKDYGN